MAHVAPRVGGEETLHVHAASCTGEIFDDAVRARQARNGTQGTVRNGSGWLAEQIVAMAAELHPDRFDKDVQRETSETIGGRWIRRGSLTNFDRSASLVCAPNRFQLHEFRTSCVRG